MHMIYVSLTLLLSLLTQPIFSAIFNVTWKAPLHISTNITVGDTVRWIFIGTHTVTSDGSPSFQSSSQETDKIYEVTFNEPGNYHYFCAVHLAINQDGWIYVSPKIYEITWNVPYHQNVAIKTGEIIQWNFVGAHSVISDGTPTFTSSPQQTGGIYKVQFDNPGTYHFYCGVHGAVNQDGNIIVTAPTMAPTLEPTMYPSSNPTTYPTMDQFFILHSQKPTMQILDTGDGFIQLYISINLNERNVNITLIGPNNRWYGIGFSNNANAVMLDTYAIVCNPNQGSIQARKLGDHNSGTLLKTFTGNEILKDELNNNLRTVIIQRDITADAFSFPKQPTSIYGISAFGNTDLTIEQSTAMGGRKTAFPISILSDKSDDANTLMINHCITLLMGLFTAYTFFNAFM